MRASTGPSFALLAEEESSKAAQPEASAIACDFLQVELLKIWAKHQQSIDKEVEGQAGGGEVRE